MTIDAAPAVSPIERIANEAPAWSGVALSVAGRLIGAALALYIAADEPYDRTQVFGVVLAASAIASLAPLRGAAGLLTASGGAGLLFFGGASLWSETAGAAMLVTGAAAWAGALIAGYRRDVSAAWGVAGFFAALGVLIATVVAIALAVEG